MWKQAGWRQNIFPKTQSRPSSYTHKPSLVISLFLSGFTIERENSSLLFSFMAFSGCLLLSPHESFTHQTHYLCLSHSLTAPTHSATLMSPQTITLAIRLKKLEVTLLRLLSTPYSFFLTLSLCSFLYSFILHLICLLLFLSGWLSDRACRHDMHPASEGDASLGTTAKTNFLCVDSQRPCTAKTDLKHFLYTHLQFHHNFNLGSSFLPF